MTLNFDQILLSNGNFRNLSVDLYDIAGTKYDNCDCNSKWDSKNWDAVLSRLRLNNPVNNVKQRSVSAWIDMGLL